MCGIAGFLDFNKKADNSVLEDMINTLKHRGPDEMASALFNSNEAIVGLAQAKMSLETKNRTRQLQMHLNTFAVAFDGNISNKEELRIELSRLGYNFISDSDTEVVMHGFSHWGQDAVNHFEGVYAFAILDKNLKELIIVRDRAGVKPLYFYWYEGMFLFASELKAFHKHPDFHKVIDQKALRLFFDYGYIPAPFTIYENCYKLEPGHKLRINLSDKTISKEVYWDVMEIYSRPKLDWAYSDLKNRFIALLESAARKISGFDVEFGVFLSGGYDSSVIAAFLQKDLGKKLKTFTIGFEGVFDEAPYAREVSRYLGTDHTEYYFSRQDAHAIIPQLAYIFDEPFADSSAIPTVLVCSLARKQVKVGVFADGGDELFAGYDVYNRLQSAAKKIEKIPMLLRPALKSMVNLNRYFPFIPEGYRYKLDGVSKSLQGNSYKRMAQMYKAMTILPHMYESMFTNPVVPYKTFYDISCDTISDELDFILAMDFLMYLPNAGLTKADRSAMSASLTGMEPLLDRRLVEFIIQLPAVYKNDGTHSKILLKDIVHDHIPKNLMDRKKKGFTFPINEWLKGDLEYLSDEYLNEKKLSQSQLFNVSFVTERIKAFKNDKLHYLPIIWRMLIFQMWYDRWMY